MTNAIKIAEFKNIRQIAEIDTANSIAKTKMQTKQIKFKYVKMIAKINNGNKTS